MTMVMGVSEGVAGPSTGCQRMADKKRKIISMKGETIDSHAHASHLSFRLHENRRRETTGRALIEAMLVSIR